MKQTAQQLKRQAQIKQKLKDFYKYMEIDFLEYEGNIYMNCKDSVMIKATDLWENLELERKESIAV